ncbi:hypothetical protein B0A49_04273 [Cryomyces minteri]|uniref:YTH domain-containing protein n=1 Tax=Cryomyces minteri TaxID=331657 RepID=A0A4U0XD43_9PEZI|nr:hypothetical protein B0A49_04273 [Cryomyces minteri]
MQWVAVPIVVGHFTAMGDAAENIGRLTSDPQRASLSKNHGQSTPPASVGLHPESSDASEQPYGSEAPFYSQYSSIPPSQRNVENPRYTTQQGPASYPRPSVQDQSGQSFDMSFVAGALPDLRHQQSRLQNQQAMTGASAPALVYQLQQNPQFPGQTIANYPGQAPFVTGYNQGPYAAGYMPGPHSVFTSQRSAGPSPNQQSYPTFQQQAPPYYYYPTPYGPSSQQHPEMYGTRTNMPRAQGTVPQQGLEASVYGASFPLHGGSGQPNSPPVHQGQGVENVSMSSTPRGPPRKPKQSGHALWVGNLPPGTTVLDLKDHFSRDATKDIESLFLISKSNCAFVNYRTEPACTAAMSRFHDSRFHGVRLVCRLRRGSAPPLTASGSTPRTASVPSIDQSRSSSGPIQEEQLPLTVAGTTREPPEAKASSSVRVAEKFFVVKSLTLQDLETSVRTGTWATQAHNEGTLNRGYESADNVYLIFSANNSGEYYGYARMASAISDDPSAVTSLVPKPEALDPFDGPKSIPTPATEFAPKGRIIDDSARGTIFWEADLSEPEDEETTHEGQISNADRAEAEGSTVGQEWGKPFKIEWISTNRLPFYRTRGLRNPWNANREVKIARDGTELETSVGKRLVQMFHRSGPLVGASGSDLPPPDETQTRPY